MGQTILPHPTTPLAQTPPPGTTNTTDQKTPPPPTTPLPRTPPPGTTNTTDQETPPPASQEAGQVAEEVAALHVPGDGAGETATALTVNGGVPAPPGRGATAPERAIPDRARGHDRPAVEADTSLDAQAAEATATIGPRPGGNVDEESTPERHTDSAPGAELTDHAVHGSREPADSRPSPPTPPTPPPPPHEQLASTVLEAPLRRGAEGTHRIRVSLRPDELGGVDLDVELHADGELHVHLAAHERETVHVLQAALGDLRSDLEREGFTTGRFGVSHRGPRSGDTSGDPAGGETDRRGHGNQAGGRRGSATGSEIQAAAVSAARSDPSATVDLQV